MGNNLKNFNLIIQHFGKIKSADLKLSPFTVIVGPNSCGKSFITKALYSIFHTINKDLVTESLLSQISLAHYVSRQLLERIIRISNKEITLLTQLTTELSLLEDKVEKNSMLASAFNNKTLFAEIIQVYPILLDLYAQLSDSLKVGKGTKLKSVKAEIQLLLDALLEIGKIFNKDSYERLISEHLKIAFLENFQISSLSALTSQKSEKENQFSFSHLGSIKLREQDVDFTLQQSGINELQQLYNVVYLESPIYFKIKNALRTVRLSNASVRRKGFLNQVPQYFYDIERLLDSKITGINDEFIPILKRIEHKINGSININNGDISFIDYEQKGLEVPLNMVSSGISNLGLIALLIRQNVLSKGSYLFIDEPEINLHTEWQHFMLDILVELSKKGVMVVIATHSLDMIYRLEHIVSNEEKELQETHFSLNRLSKEGISYTRKHILADIREAKEELGRPYVELLKMRLP